MKSTAIKKIGKFTCVCVLSVSFLQGSIKPEEATVKAISVQNPLAVSILSTVKTASLIFPYEKEAWNYKAVSADVAYSKGITGKGVKVAVLDTGIARNEDLHIAGGYSVTDEPYDTDLNGHGTHVAGIIASTDNNWATIGIAPDVELYSVKVLNEQGSGGPDDLIKGINWAIENKMDIINLSVSMEYGSPELTATINSAYDAGITIVAGAGNNSGHVRLPAVMKNVIGVSAIDETKTLASFSSRGSGVDVTAPGVNIISTHKDGFGWGNGTSQATPHVTGLLALLKQENPTFDNKMLEAELYRHTDDLGEIGKDINYGHGLINYTSFNNRADKDEQDSLTVERKEAEELEKELKLREAEREQLAKDKAKHEEQLIADKKEKERLAKKEKADKLKADKLKAEKAKKLKAEKLKAKKLKAEKAKKLKAEKLKAEKLKAEKAKKLKAEKLKAEKLKAEKAKKLKAEKLKAEKAKKLKAEKK